MTAYNNQLFAPPAPVAYVALRNADKGTICSDVPMLLDFGADITLIPALVLGQLEVAASVDRQYELSGFDGTKSFAPIVRLELTFCRRRFRGDFLIIDQEWGILGRNILNTIALVLNGPQLIWHEQTGNT